MSDVVKGYKVFNPDWTCRGKQYACPGKFEEDVELSVCGRGMDFCGCLADCFKYYDFDPNNKAAEVVAYGKVVMENDKYVTDKLEIVREIPWEEVIKLVNSGDCNSGNYNSGNYNSGDCNSGNCNSGDCNSGNYNSGNYNSGNRNSGDCNSGNYNSGDCNSDDCNSGDCNSGNCNSGNYNSGNRNSGNRNSGNRNSGNRNSGDCNSGNYNSGNCNSGDWNKCNFSNGCFNTGISKIYMFDKISDWTYSDWFKSRARHILSGMPYRLDYIYLEDMTEKEIKNHPEAEVTGGYLKQMDYDEKVKEWWKSLTDKDKNCIKSLPNFDPDIFKEITGIDVNW